MFWYDHNKRDLPWRKSRDPYVIWLSEIILQQTRVKQGLPYFEKFLDAYPSVEKLALADEQAILRRWQGLGYYSRAKNLHACAKIILVKYKGSFPNNFKELLFLKGVGKYTAAAIASFAFNERVAVVDGNVYRVLSRVFGIDDDIASSEGQKKFQLFAEKLLPEHDAATYNQAIMEFGALQCVPVNPACEGCINKTFCFAYKFKMQDQLPFKTNKVKVRTRHFNYFVIRGEGKILMKERVQKDIWSGLYDFYMVESARSEEVDIIDDIIIERLKLAGMTISDTSKTYKHILTHQRLFAKFYLVDLPDLANVELAFGNLKDAERYKFFSNDEIMELPKPILIDKYLTENIFFN